jgi:hypothetical protein
VWCGRKATLAERKSPKIKVSGWISLKIPMQWRFFLRHVFSTYGKVEI